MTIRGAAGRQWLLSATAANSQTRPVPAFRGDEMSGGKVEKAELQDRGWLSASVCLQPVGVAPPTGAFASSLALTRSAKFRKP